MTIQSIMAGGPFSSVLPIPGGWSYRTYANLEFGRRLRDADIYEFPLLAEGVDLFCQMAAGREWKVSGPVRTVSRFVDWLNEARTVTYDGVINYGFEDFLRRRARDYLTIGRTLFYADPANDPLTYLDPAVVTYNVNNASWDETYIQVRYKRDYVTVNHPMPLGTSGAFSSPLMAVIPTAILNWLIREHDRASLDGRKLRDVMIVSNKELADEIKVAVEDMAAVWSGAEVSKVGIPVVATEAQGYTSVGDQISRLGLSNIPATFDREGFQFVYVNQVAAALGLSLRHIWNSEQATNRALEEVQEARQQQKGPTGFVRTEQRLLNAPRITSAFGREVRFAFIEEVDLQSREVNAKVLKTYIESALLMNQAAAGQINLPALFGWLQSEDILPADIDLLLARKPGDDTLINSGEIPSVNPDEGVTQQNSQVQPGKSLDLDYDHVSMNQHGEIIDSRRRGIPFAKVLAPVVQAEKALEELPAPKPVSKIEPPEGFTFEEALAKAHADNYARFSTLCKSLSPRQITDVIGDDRFALVEAALNADTRTAQQNSLILTLIPILDGIKNGPPVPE